MAVEFALAMPMLVLFVGARIQFGTLFFVLQRMENTAREVIQSMIAQDLAVDASATTYCLSLITDDVTAEKTACDLLGALDMGFVVAALQPDPADPVNRNVSLTITVPMTDAAPVDILGLFGSEDLQANVTTRKVEL